MAHFQTGDLAQFQTGASNLGIHMKKLVFCALTALVLSACETPPTSTPPPDAASYPQPPSVSLDDLARALPKDAEGRPILTTVEGTALTIGPKRVDAIGAAAACRDLKNGCVQATKQPDVCIDTVKRCTSTTPWLENDDCCPVACVDAYKEQRRLGAEPVAANAAVFGSTHECFPGLQERIRAAGGTPRLMPRRTP